jgi:hypothetical protein
MCAAERQQTIKLMRRNETADAGYVVGRMWRVVVELRRVVVDVERHRQYYCAHMSDWIYT